MNREASNDDVAAVHWCVFLCAAAAAAATSHAHAHTQTGLSDSFILLVFRYKTLPLPSAHPHPVYSVYVVTTDKIVLLIFAYFNR